MSDQPADQTPPEAQAPASPPYTASVNELPPRKTHVSDLMLQLSRRKPPRQPLPPGLRGPFDLPSFPPGVGPTNKRLTLANDKQISGTRNWASRLAMDAVPMTSGWSGGTEAVYPAEAMYNAYAEGIVFLGFSYLAMLAQRAEYRVITETIASEMTREWIELKSISSDKSQTEKIKALTDALDKFKLREVFRKAAESDGFFGRGHIFIDTGDTDDRDELVTSLGNGRDEVSRFKISHHKIKAFRPVEAVWCYPTHYESTDPLKSGWYDPYQWYVMSKPVHKTRLLTFIGREVPDILKPAYAFGGLSMSQMVKPYVDNWLATRQSVADLIRAFSVFVLHTNMDASTGVGAEDLFKRVQVFNNFKDNQGCMVLDKDTEDFNNVSVPLGGLDALQAQSQEHMASIARIPIVKLLGIQPAGLNASSEGELISFYDWIHAFQETLFREKLTTCIDMVQLSEFGGIDDDITFDFKSLRQLDDGQEVSIQAQKGQVHSTYVDMGAVDAAEVRESLSMDPDSPYAGLDLTEPLPAPGGMGMPGMPPMPPMPQGPQPQPSPGGGAGGGGPPGPGAQPNPGPGGGGGPAQATPRADMVSSPETHDFGHEGFGNYRWKSPVWGRAHDQSYDYAFDDFDPHEARDPSGKWTEGGGGGGAPGKTKKTSHLVDAPTDRSQFPAHLQKVKLPPAWTDLKISPDAKQDLWAIGKDVKGRQQYFYSPSFAQSRQAQKYKRIASLHNKIDSMLNKNDRNMKARDPDTRESAAVQHLIMKMGLRPGSERETGAEQTAFGATTLQGRHVVTDPETGQVSLRFIGKKGVSNNLPVTDEALAKELSERAKKAGDDGKLFSVDDNKLRRYVKQLGGGKFKVKDFRTHLGTSLAQSLVSDRPLPKSPQEYKKAVKDVATGVAQRLGNTPAIALGSYISPFVFADWKQHAGVA